MMHVFFKRDVHASFFILEMGLHSIYFINIAILLFT